MQRIPSKIKPLKARSLEPRSVHSEEYKLLASMLRDARLAAGLTQREIAVRLNKPPSFAHKVERAERELNVVELMDYCAALDVDFLTFTQDVYREIQGLPK